MRILHFTMSKLSSTICENNSTLKLNCFKGTSNDNFSRQKQFLSVTGNSLRLLQKGDIYYTRIQEQAMFNSCNNYLPPFCNSNRNVSAHSKASRDCHNHSLPPISSNLELRENKSPEKTKVNSGKEVDRNTVEKKEIRSNTSCCVGTSVNNFNATSPSSIPPMKESTGYDMDKTGNPLQNIRSGCMNSGGSMKLGTAKAALSSPANRQMKKPVSGSLPQGGSRRPPKMISVNLSCSTNVQPNKTDSSLGTCLQSNSVGKAKDKRNSGSQQTENISELLPTCVHSKTQQPSSAAHDLSDTQTIMETKPDLSTTEDIPNWHKNICEKQQQTEACRQTYWQFDCNNHLQQIPKPQVVIKKKSQLASSSTLARDFSTERAKNSNDKKITSDKKCKTPVELVKPACLENINVEKIVEAVSFHRWSNKPQLYESDCQLLMDSVQASMGPTLAEREAEKIRKRSKRLQATSRSCISLLLETYKKNKHRCAPSATKGTRKRKRVFPHKKTKKKEK